MLRTKNESGFYSLILSSKLESAKKFKHWVTSPVLTSNRKYGQYKLFDNPSSNMFKIIENETDLHYKGVQYIRRFHSNAILLLLDLAKIKIRLQNELIAGAQNIQNFSPIL